MTITTPVLHRTGRQLLSVFGLGSAAFVVAVTAVVTPAAAAPEEGVPTTSQMECAPVGWGWPNGADGLSLPRCAASPDPECYELVVINR